MMMTTDQTIRLQCLELAVKAGTPWSRLTEMADKLTAYVKGVSTAPAVEVQNTSMFAALSDQGLAEIKRTGKMPTTTALDDEPAKGIAIEDEPPLRINLRNCPDCGAGEGLLHAKGCKTLAEMNAVDSWGNQRGVAVEDPDPVATARAIVAQHDARIAAEKATVTVTKTGDAWPNAIIDVDLTGGKSVLPQTVANDPRLPLVTM